MAAPIKGTGNNAKHAKSWIPKLKGTGSEARSRLAEDARQRKEAGNQPKSVILNANDVQGNYDANRVLMTTLGGVVRPITSDDLAAFRYNIKQTQSRYTGGIRARQVLDMSLAIDRERANKQIRVAVPVSAMGGKIRFLTNASEESDVTQHHVLVDLLSYSSAASGARGDAKKSALWLRKEPLKIECDCGRWRFWYRYIATIGKFNAGRDETGFPKIRNPNLHGVACKHILRVMAELESSSSVLNFLTRLIEKARAKDDNQVRLALAQKEAEKLAKKQTKQSRDVETSLRKRQQAREKAALARAAKKQKPPAPKKTTPATRKAQAAIEFALQTGKINQAWLDMTRGLGMTDAQISNLLKKAT